MSDNYYRGAKVNQNAQAGQSGNKPKDFVYRGVKHQAQQQADSQQTSGVYRGAKWYGGTEKNGQMR